MYFFIYSFISDIYPGIVVNNFFCLIQFKFIFNSASSRKGYFAFSSLLSFSETSRSSLYHENTPEENQIVTK